MTNAIHHFYIVVPHEWKYMKIGRWTSTISTLCSRYATYYGKFTIYVFQCADSVVIEREASKKLAMFHWYGELYHLDGLTSVLNFAEITCLPYVAARDLLVRLNNAKVERQKREEMEALRQRTEMQKKEFLNSVGANMQKQLAWGDTLPDFSPDSNPIPSTSCFKGDKQPGQFQIDSEFLELKQKNLELRKLEAELRLRKRQERVEKLQEFERQKREKEELERQKAAELALEHQRREQPNPFLEFLRELVSKGIIREKPKALTKITTIRDAYNSFPNYQSGKLDMNLFKEISPSWSIQKYTTCKTCKNIFAKGCCSSYSQQNKSSSDYIMNMEWVD